MTEMTRFTHHCYKGLNGWPRGQEVKGIFGGLTETSFSIPWV